MAEKLGPVLPVVDLPAAVAVELKVFLDLSRHKAKPYSSIYIHT